MLIEIVRRLHEEKQYFISKIISSNVPSLSPEDNLNSGEISTEGKTELSNYNLEEKYDVYANIKYKIKDGEVIEEKFKLNIVTTISETNNQVNVLQSEK